jgi:TetR/AcrR family transcriptional regulator, transcriptional repressor for nem operon
MSYSLPVPRSSVTRTTKARRATALTGEPNAPPAPDDARPQPAGARKDAKEQTRAALVAAAGRVFHERGLDASLDEICAAAGYTRGAFYVHFKDREDLIAAAVTETNQQRVESLIARGEDALDLERTIRGFAEAIRTGAFPGIGAVQLHQFLAAVERSPRVRTAQQQTVGQAKAKLALAVREGQAAGTVRRDVRPEPVAELLLALVGGVEMMLAFGSPPDVEGLARSLLRMLRPPKT